MSWKVFADRIETADLGSTSRSIRFKMGEDSFLLAAKLWLVFFGNPSLTSLKLKLYSDNGGVPGVLLHTSADVLKVAMLSRLNGCRCIPFAFNAPYGVPVQGSTWYHLVLDGAGYTGTESSHVAIKKAFPKPVYTSGLSVTHEKLGVMPYDVTLIGSRVE